uniref:Agouti domain-containing protein n=1 Tax=Salarias fasciatus TaxID=181472 RepID=A0A672F695_SALFA
MKLSALALLCLLQLALVHGGLFSRHELQASSRGAGSPNQSRVRPLFARRGQLERQRIHVPKPKVAPGPPNHVPAPAKKEANAAKPPCSQLTHTCLPLSGCCDAHASCHCRFFNTICYCRRVKPQHESRHNASASKPGKKYTNATEQ